tara:strand:- start:653 stop:1243 length:591 start_codon:yes stop_codon:yes gene_type:complete
MSENEAFRYDKMVEAALRSVVIRALEEIAENGLFDDHHFYITFRTDYPGVEIPDYLKERYPGEMTIVLQHQFYDLDIKPDKFSVMLKFNNVPEKLIIPLGSVTIFTDPSVNFALQFQPLSEDDDEDYDADDVEDDIDDEDTDDDSSGEVISLDQFRAKGKDDKKKPKSKSKSKSKPKSKKKGEDKDEDTDDGGEDD